ncbi:hypothetical protein C4J81_17835 [Deltaproteobacteria bacterium Smac51]|nr:hypothetical protein C4J81_17835 [Deltaproteobacteria bacterium Smac51]
MKMNLSARMFIITALACLLAVIPYCLYMLKSLKDNYIQREMNTFNIVGSMALDGLSIRYTTYISSLVRELNEHKRELRRAAVMLRQTGRDLRDETLERRTEIFSSHLEYLAGRGFGALWLTADGQVVPPFDGHSRIPALDDLNDVAGRPLSAFLNARELPPLGRLLVFRAHLEGLEGERLMVAFLLPAGFDGQLIMAYDDITRLETGDGRILNQIVAELSELFQQLSMDQRAAVYILDGGRNVLSSTASSLALPPADMLDEALRGGRAERLIPKGPEGPARLVHAIHFRPLDWFIVLTISQEASIKPVLAIGREMVGVGLMVILASLAASAYLASRMARPVKALSAKVRAVAGLDFASPGAEDFFADDPAFDKTEELRQFHDSFTNMGRTLVSNVRELVASSAARQRVEGELNAARDIQLGILPPPEDVRAAHGFEAAAFLQSAREVGGDLYDVFESPCGRTALVIGDVSDKGVPAALFMTMTVTLARRTIADGHGPAEAMTRINESLSANNPTSMFSTLIIALFEPSTGALEYANGGHERPLVFGPGGVRTLEGAGGPMVGALPGVTFTSNHDFLDIGESCFLFTDGVTEAQNENGQFFGRERLQELTGELSGLAPGEFLAEIDSRVARFRGAAPQSDDITMLCFRR